MRKIIFIFILFVSCSSNKERGVTTLSDANKESNGTETISEEDYTLSLTECLYIGNASNGTSSSASGNGTRNTSANSSSGDVIHLECSVAHVGSEEDGKSC